MRLIPAADPALRAALDLDGAAIGEHAELVAAVNKAHPHSIRFVASFEGTCATYALDLGDDPIYRAIASAGDGSVFAGRRLMEWLLDGRLVETGIPEIGALVVYFSGDRWTHVGRLVGPTRVRSKWGVFPVYEHGTFEVPSAYGETVRFFHSLEPSAALNLFIKFAEQESLSRRR